MEDNNLKVIKELEKTVEFFNQLGIDFISKMSSSKSADYSELKKRILNCQRCALARTRKNAVPGEGNIDTDLMFVGEAPGGDEDIQGKPFVGKAGQLLTRIINAMTFERKDIYITNIIKCRPPHNRNPYSEEIDKCKGYLLKQIDMINPKVIVTLGKVASDFFIRSTKGMTSLRGEFYDFGNIKVMPTFHPSYLVRNPGNKQIKKMVWEDMKKVMVLLGKK
ncbi:MAG: uracil-DNA glycosylase [Candidatus Aminicenantaceae bacterium]